MKSILSKLGVPYACDEPLAAHTSFKIGGPADFFARPSSEEQLAELITYLKNNDIPFFVMGNGTNLLADDEGFRGVVISLGSNFSEVRADGEGLICAQAGCLLSRAALFAMEQGLTGLEFAHGIPGTLGGGIYMNAGAYGGEMANITAEISYLGPDMTLCRMDGSQAGFGYRRSIFKEHRGWIVTGARLALEKGDRGQIELTMKELAQRRRDKQPLEYPSAGSTFKRPEGDYAARLIEVCGLKGCSLGGAMVSEKHAGFVINRGGATSRDVLKLMEHIQKEVLRQTGIELRPEVERLRPFNIQDI